MHWSVGDIADAIEAGLVRQAREDDLAQVVHGFDSLDELGLHPLIAQALAKVGLGVWPEQRYPGHQHKSKKSEGLRCDLVLTPDRLPLSQGDARGTLFESITPAVDAEAAYWLEIKTVAQFQAGQPFPRYASELLSPVAADIKKIWSDSIIAHGGLLIVLFTACQQVAEHDLAIWQQRCLQRGYPINWPAVRGFAINDRTGNGWCCIAVFGVRGG